MPNPSEQATAAEPPHLTPCPKCGSAHVDMVEPSWESEFVYLRCVDCDEVWSLVRSDASKPHS